MAFVPQTQNLKLWKPTPDDYDSLPNWGELLNQNADIIDQLGAPVTPSRMDINADLPFNGRSALTMASARFNSRLAIYDDQVLNALYVVNGDLFFNDASGAATSLMPGVTDNGIGGLPSTPVGAAVNYANASGFTFLGFGGNFYSPLVTGPLGIFDTVSGLATYGITLKSPASLGASYDLTLPTAVPLSTLPVVMSATGELSTAQLVTAQIADAAVTRAKLANVAPTSLTLSSGWTGTLRYWKDATGTVHVQGNLQSSSAGTAVTPNGSAPVPYATGQGYLAFWIQDITGAGAVAVAVNISPAGAISLQTAPTPGHVYNFSGVTYLEAI